MPDSTRRNDFGFEDLPVIAQNQPAQLNDDSLPQDDDEDTDIKLIRANIFDRKSETLSETDKGRWMLMAFKAWTELEKEVRDIIEPRMIKFIANKPIPGNNEIRKEIMVQAKQADQLLTIRKNMDAQANVIPDDIRKALFSEIEQVVADNAQMVPGEIQNYSDMLMKEAGERIERAQAEGIFDIAEITIFIAGDAIRATRKRILKLHESEPRTHSGIRLTTDSKISDTIPDTPLAKVNKIG